VEVCCVQEGEAGHEQDSSPGTSVGRS
jgi:hypothetical protein